MVGWVCAHTLLPQRTQQLWTDECTWKQVRHLSENSVWTKWWLVCVHHRNVDQKHPGAAAAGVKTGSQEFWRLFWAGSIMSLVQNNSVYFSDVITKEWSGYCESEKEKSLHVCETRSCLKSVSQGGEQGGVLQRQADLHQRRLSWKQQELFRPLTCVYGLSFWCPGLSSTSSTSQSALEQWNSATYRLLSMLPGMGLMSVISCSSMVFRLNLSSDVMRLIANPRWPNLPESVNTPANIYLQCTSDERKQTLKKHQTDGHQHPHFHILDAHTSVRSVDFFLGWAGMKQTHAQQKEE